MKDKMIYIFITPILTFLLLILVSCPMPEIIEWEVEGVSYNTNTDELYIHLNTDLNLAGYLWYLDIDLEREFNEDTYSIIINIGNRNISSIDKFENLFTFTSVTPPSPRLLLFILIQKNGFMGSIQGH
jgi:hypothetical protein